MLLFGGETIAGPVNDLHVLRGLPTGDGGSSGKSPPEGGKSSPVWAPLEAAGAAPAARKGHAIAGGLV